MLQKRNFIGKLPITAFSGILVLLLFLTGIVSCRKELETESKTTGKTAIQDRSEESNPTVTHGMLHFDTHGKLKEFIQALKSKEADSVQVKNAYTALGVNVNAEFLPNLTDHPVCLLKEQAIGGYTSARKAEEIIINAALNSGNDNINSIVSLPHWKTALNADNAVHIGRRIYKYYDNGGIAIVLNDDWDTYEKIRTKSFEEADQTHNLLVTSEDRVNWDKYFVLDGNGEIISDKEIYLPLLTTLPLANGKKWVINASLVEVPSGDPVYKWIYKDGSYSFGLNPDREINGNESVKVKIDKGGGTIISGPESDEWTCAIGDFEVTPLSDGSIRFFLSGFDPSKATIRWILSDGSTSTTNPFIKTNAPASGTATCQLLYIGTNTVACQFSKPYTIVKCGEYRTHKEQHVFEQRDGNGNNNQRWKLDGEIWVQAGEVGCSVKYLRWRGAILKWQPANNDASTARISGIYVREVNNPNKNCLDIIASGRNDLGSGTWPTTISFTIPEVPKVFRKPGALNATLGIRVHGVFNGWGFAGKPVLVLP